jgi:DNA repair exonuclease SbcCD ATPase subunit
MSDTPRTDAVERLDCDDPWIHDTVVPSDCSRQLERELAAVTAERDANNRHLVARTNELETLKTAHMYLAEELKTVKAELNSERMLGAYQSAERDELQRYKEYHEWAEGQIAAVTKKPITTLGALAKEFSALAAERDELLADKERLDWLLKNWPLLPMGINTSRAAIDAVKGGEK